jgi:pimeloyl-ACP methyl ester carboxylesterase
MTESKPQFLTVGEADKARSIAWRARDGQGPTVVWIGGFRSDMLSTKATALDQWAQENKRAFLRFDYSGNGESGGDFEKATLSDWLEEALAVIRHAAKGPVVLVGSSMGGWISLLIARALKSQTSIALKGMVLIAPAVDFTEELMWAKFSPDIRKSIMEDGFFMNPSEYGAYPITRALIEDGRNHLLFGSPITPGCPVHILQGMQDDPVPWPHAMKLVEHLPDSACTLTLIKDGDHRLSRPQDLDRLIASLDTLLNETA